jgi:predicted nucleotidyltransferase
MRAPETFPSAVADTARVLASADLTALVVGELATALLAREPAEWRPSELDLFLRPEDADAAADLLEERGFASADPEGPWCRMVTRPGVRVVLRSRLPGDVYVDEEMAARAIPTEFEGVNLLLIPAEDLAVVKALAHGEDRPAEWWDALAIVGRSDLDWTYLRARARQYGVHRVLSLLFHARSLGTAVPDQVLGELFDFLEERRQT